MRPLRPAASVGPVLGAVLCGVLAAAGAAAPGAATSTGEPDTGVDVDLRVVSYNMHTGIGADGALDLDRTAATLERLDADVIGLQEVDQHWSARSEWRDQARELADRLRMRVYFAPIYDLEPAAPDQPRRRYGLALLTSLDLPMVDTENHEITRLSTQSGSDPVPAPAPGFPEVVVRAGGAPVHVYATHLDYRADPAVRALQVDDTLSILSEDGPEAQQVLLGDLNAPPAAPELAPLWQRLTDAWRVAGSGAGRTYPAAAPTKRIDYVAVSPDISVRSAHVVDTQASDHRPVVADLVVRRGR